MASVMVALDQSTRENGCLQVVKGSHLLGRNDPYLEHHHPPYTPLSKVADGELKKAGLKLSAGIDAFRRGSSNPPELHKRIPRVLFAHL